MIDTVYSIYMLNPNRYTPECRCIWGRFPSFISSQHLAPSCTQRPCAYSPIFVAVPVYASKLLLIFAVIPRPAHEICTHLSRLRTREMVAFFSFCTKPLYRYPVFTQAICPTENEFGKSQWLTGWSITSELCSVGPTAASWFIRLGPIFKHWIESGDFEFHSLRPWDFGHSDYNTYMFPRTHSITVMYGSHFIGGHSFRRYRQEGCLVRGGQGYSAAYVHVTPVRHTPVPVIALFYFIFVFLYLYS